jgi:hypothetical protein
MRAKTVNELTLDEDRRRSHKLSPISQVFCFY